MHETYQLPQRQEIQLKKGQRPWNLAGTSPPSKGIMGLEVILPFQKGLNR